MNTIVDNREYFEKIMFTSYVECSLQLFAVNLPLALQLVDRKPTMSECFKTHSYIAYRESIFSILWLAVCQLVVTSLLQTAVQQLIKNE